MTFCLALGNADQIIQVTDRRLTDFSGKLFDDSSNKSGHAICDDAAFLYCFTGLATAGTAHTTSQWIMDALCDAAQNSHFYRALVDYFAEKATEYFQKSNFINGISPAARRLTVMMTGYTANNYIFNTLVSNFQDFKNFIDYPVAQSRFTVHAERTTIPASDNPVVMQVVGQFKALTDQDVSQLSGMLERRAPAEALRQKAIALIQEISDRPASQGTVGKKLNTSRLLYSGPTGPISGYASDEPEKTLHLIDRVDLRTGAPKILISAPQISAQNPIVIPKVHRNAPCPCGSGKKYRDCHRQPYVR